MPFGVGCFRRRCKVHRRKGENRVLRGGSYFNNAENCRCANRNHNHPENRNDISVSGWPCPPAHGKGRMASIEQAVVLSLVFAPGRKGGLLGREAAVLVADVVNAPPPVFIRQTQAGSSVADPALSDAFSVGWGWIGGSASLDPPYGGGRCIKCTLRYWSERRVHFMHRVLLRRIRDDVLTVEPRPFFRAFVGHAPLCPTYGSVYRLCKAGIQGEAENR